MSHYTILYKYGKRVRASLGRFWFYFSLVCCILEAFLTKQLFHPYLINSNNNNNNNNNNNTNTNNNNINGNNN